MGTSTSSGSPTSNNELASILAKAWTDNGYKSRLQTDPQAAFQEMRADIRTYVPNYDPNRPVSINIPNPPAGVTEMTQTQVQAAASTSLSSGAEMF